VVERLLAEAGVVVPGAAPGSNGAAEGTSETSSAQTVDVHGLYDFILRTDAGPGDCGYIIGKVGDLARELEQARRDNARLREENRGIDLERDEAARRVEVLEQQVATQRDTIVSEQQATAEAAERAWALEQKLAALGAGPRVRELLEKNARTIRLLRAQRAYPYSGSWRAATFRRWELQARYAKKLGGLP
jgi:hypothetical protein